MGLFNSEPQVTPPPNRGKREQCWDARDRFLTCIEKNGVVNPADDKEQATIKSKCSKEDQLFGDKCAKSWVVYFKEKYVVDAKRERFLKEMEEKGGKQLPFPINK